MKVTDKITITNEDNMELMARYPDNYFDLAIVDPPYGIGAGKGVGVTRGKENQYTVKDWDISIPKQKYWNELFRVSKNQIVWGGNYMTDFLKPSRGWIYWQKLMGGNYADGELAWTSFDRNLKEFTKRSDQGNRFHPTQKPVKLYEWLLHNYATCKTCKNEGGYYEDVAGDGGSQMYINCDDCNGGNVKILDTHLGSGSIAIACHNRGFELTACELDKDYYDAAIKRIKNHTAQTTIFDLGA